MRRQFTPEQKAQVAFAALKGDKTINQVAAEFEIHPTQAQIDELHSVIGLRDAELLWLKKLSMGRSIERG